MPRVRHHRLLSSPLHDLISFWHADNNGGHPTESFFCTFHEGNAQNTEKTATNKIVENCLNPNKFIFLSTSHAMPLLFVSRFSS
jgi:hypothetical protein